MSGVSGAPVGVVDIGSNSIRLVVYGGGRAAVPMFNEKILCALGRGVAVDGTLHDDSIACSLAALARFRALIGTMEVSVTAVATAAVREAANGGEFIRRAGEALGADIRVLSGQEEAHQAAQGVLSAIPDANGLVGDLGGGSLELVAVSGGATGENATLPLGTLRLAAAGKNAGPVTDAALAGLPWLADFSGRSLYVVGGAWRNLARLNMERTGYPLRVLHHYVMPAQEAVSVAGMVENLSQPSLERISGLARRRLPVLPAAAAVLARLLEATGVAQVVVSAYGLREGLLFDTLPEEARRIDPLLDGVRAIAATMARSVDYGDEVAAWSEPLAGVSGGETPDQSRLRHAACLAGDIGWRTYHRSNQRAVFSMNQLLMSSLIGLDHAGRLFLARVIFHRYAGTGQPPWSDQLRRLEAPGSEKQALILGLALRLAHVISASMPGVLGKTRLRLGDGTLELELPSSLEVLQGEVLSRRLEQLARAMERRGGLAVKG